MKKIVLSAALVAIAATSAFAEQSQYRCAGIDVNTGKYAYHKLVVATDEDAAKKIAAASVCAEDAVVVRFDTCVKCDTKAQKDATAETNS